MVASLAANRAAKLAGLPRQYAISSIREDTLQEPFPVPVEDVPHPLDLDNVNAGTQHVVSMESPG